MELLCPSVSTFKIYINMTKLYRTEPIPQQLVGQSFTLPQVQFAIICPATPSCQPFVSASCSLPRSTCNDATN